MIREKGNSLIYEVDNLNYIGNKPDIKYYSLIITFVIMTFVVRIMTLVTKAKAKGNISLDDYNQINSSNWNLKEECLKYF